MEWAKEIFMFDVGLKSWLEVKKKFGVSIEEGLFIYAHNLKATVKAPDVKNKKSRPVTYLDWLKKILMKVLLINIIHF